MHLEAVFEGAGDSDDNLMNRKNIRFKLGIGAKLLGYRRTAVGV